jgi:hypothetical protein
MNDRHERRLGPSAALFKGSAVASSNRSPLNSLRWPAPCGAGHHRGALVLYVLRRRLSRANLTLLDDRYLTEIQVHIQPDRSHDNLLARR